MFKLFKMLKFINVKMNQRGAALYLALIIMIILLAISLGLTAISISEIKMARDTGYSVVAFYAADTGIEHALYNILKESGTGDVSYITWGAEYGYEVTTDPCDGNTCVRSVGVYRGIKRAIQAKY